MRWRLAANERRFSSSKITLRGTSAAGACCKAKETLVRVVGKSRDSNGACSRAPADGAVKAATEKRDRGGSQASRRHGTS